MKLLRIPALALAPALALPAFAQTTPAAPPAGPAPQTAAPAPATAAAPNPSVGGVAMDAIKTIVANASAAPNLSTLVKAITAADLTATLSGPGPYTVFAPTDDAFGKIPPATIDSLKTDSATLTKILTYHVVPGRVDPANVVGTHKTVEGANVTVTGSPDALKVNNASVACGGVNTANATVYLIDTVLMPPAH